MGLRLEGSLLVLALVAGMTVMEPAVSADPSPAQQAQREKMKNCNTEASAKSLKGKPRKAFMKECLSGGKKSAAKDNADKELLCKSKAKEQGLKGDTRKAFISNCLEGGTSS